MSVQRVILAGDKQNGVVAADPKKDEAWRIYVATAQQRGEEDTITQFRFFIFVLRCYLGLVKEYVGATKDLIGELNEISEEVNGLVEMDLESTARFDYHIERYPRFMRNYVRRRRAKRYYAEKLETLRSKIMIATGSIRIVPDVLKAVMEGMDSMMVGMTKSMRMMPSSTGKKKRGAFLLPPEISQEIERRRKADESGSGSTGGDAPSGTTGGSAPAAGGSASTGGTAGDHWGDDIM